MALTLKEPVVYAVCVHNRQAKGDRGLSLHGKAPNVSAENAEAAADEARAAGGFGEVAVRAYHVAAPGGGVRPGPVTAEVDPHLGAPVLYLVEGHRGPRAEGHWFEICGDVLYASRDDAIALQAQARASGKYDEVIVLAYPVARPEEDD